MRVLAPLGWHELVGEALALGPCTTVAFGRPSLGSPPAPEGFEYVRTFLPRRDDTPAARARIESDLRALAESTGDPALAALAIEFKPLPPEDYATSWQKVWRPFRVGRLAVVAPWNLAAALRPVRDANVVATARAEPRLRPGDVLLRLEPGAAFGSGRHATTRMMLRALQARLRPGERVVDAGTGSGILAVAAALLGAGEVVAFDVDPNSEPFARELAEDNGVADRCRIATGGFELLPVRERTSDAVLANIYSDVIQRHAADLRDCLRPGGWYAFSGCPAQHAEATERALSEAGLRVEERPVRGRWHTFVGTRPA